MRVRPMVGREAGTMCAVPREDDRRLVFDPRWRRRRSASMGSKPAESSRPSFVFIQALDEKCNARAIERTTKETLFEGFNSFGAAGGAGKASTRPVFEECPGAVGVTMKELHQRADRYRSMDHNCMVVADYLEVHHGVVGCLLSSIGSAVFARNVSAGGLFSSERHMTCIGYGVRFVGNRCTMPETESDYFYGQLGYRSLKANRDQSFVIVKTLQETKGNAYVFKRTMKDMLTTLFEGFGCFGVAADAGRWLRVHTSSFRSTSMLDWVRTTKHQFNERARMRFHCLRTDICTSRIELMKECSERTYVCKPIWSAQELRCGLLRRLGKVGLFPGI
ncbi:hypothetical protein HPB51_010535 [Rhipicephalus microplus]|uniref:Uncharacterized protein n=1 Tax=Rhipicephalus microplus TaxID=6941 RepID=A0A9J6D9G7_RHIMP|nr:hypothetical protein HPB51_010535 [Rhipicephalus microplus]